MKTIMIVLLILLSTACTEPLIEEELCKDLKDNILNLQVLIDHPDVRKHAPEVLEAIVVLQGSIGAYNAVCHMYPSLPQYEVPISFTI